MSIISSESSQNYAAEATINFSATNRNAKSVWKSYSSVYDLMEDADFVKDLRRRHVNALEGLCHILDGGCGTGLITEELVRHNHSTVSGLDKRPEMLARAVERLKHYSGVLLLRGDVHDLPFSKSAFDGHLSNNVLYSVDEPRDYVAEMVRVTRPGGRISIASARPSINVEVLNEALVCYLKSTDHEVRAQDLADFIEANRRLQRESMRNLYEPDEISSLLLKHGCSSILEETTVYLDQDFFVVAER